MRKYPANESVCGAIYDNAPADNPFLAALPEMLPRDEFLTAIAGLYAALYDTVIPDPDFPQTSDRKTDSQANRQTAIVVPPKPEAVPEPKPGPKLDSVYTSLTKVI